MIKGQPKIGDKVVIRWSDHPSYRIEGRSDMDICEVVTDGKRVYLRGFSAFSDMPMRAFKAANHKTVKSLFDSIGEYQHDGIIKSYHVRRKTNDRRVVSFDTHDRYAEHLINKFSK